MDDHSFFILEQYYEVGENGIRYHHELQKLLRTPEYRRLDLHKSGKCFDLPTLIQLYTIQIASNDMQTNKISEYGIETYLFEKKVRDNIQEKLDNEQLLKLQIADVNASVIKTNDSITILNSRTVDFYEKQRTYNTTQKWLTLAILISSVVYTAVTCLTYTSAKQASPVIQSVGELKNELHNQEMKDSIFQKAIKDSLKIP